MKLYRVSNSPDPFKGQHQRVAAETPGQAIEATQRDWAARFPASAGVRLYAHPVSLDPYDPKALDAVSMEFTRALPGDTPGEVTTPREQRETQEREQVAGAVAAWKDDAPGAAERVNDLPPGLRAQALTRLGYSTPAHRELIDP